MTDSVETNVEETIKEPITKKDPKRVEQGKRLAAISKQAKEEKMRKKIAEENFSYFPYNCLHCGRTIHVWICISSSIWEKRRNSSDDDYSRKSSKKGESKKGESKKTNPQKI